MGKRVLLGFFVSSSKELLKHKHLQSPKASIIRRCNQVCFSSNAHAHAHPYVHTQGEAGGNEEVKDSDVGEVVGKGRVESAWDAAKKSSESVFETITAEADTNVVDTSEYRSSEDLKGQLGDGCDN